MPKYHLNKYFYPSPLKFSDIFLIQIGRLYFSPSDSVHMHTHKQFYELTIITDGEGWVKTNGIEMPVSRGDIHLALPCDTHEIRSSANAPMKYDFFSFYTENESYNEKLCEICGYLSPSDRIFRDERISALICNAIMEFVNKECFSEELLYSVFNQIIIYLIRNAEHGTAAIRSRGVSQKETVCYQLMNYIDTHIYELTSLREFEKITSYNYSYLSTLFKETTGSTLSSYYQNKRLEAARQLILEGNETITKIAELLNYSSIYSFSRAFKEAYGVTPKKYGK